MLRSPARRAAPDSSPRAASRARWDENPPDAERGEPPRGLGQPVAGAPSPRAAACHNGQSFDRFLADLKQQAVAQGLRVPQVTARVFWLGLWLMTLAIAAAMARSLTFDITAFVMGLAGVWFVLFNFTRGR